MIDCGKPDTETNAAARGFSRGLAGFLGVVTPPGARFGCVRQARPTARRPVDAAGLSGPLRSG
jgi:hypothetical protein